MNRELLEQPFAPEEIHQRQGNFGNVLDYVEGSTVIQRLNDSFDGSWSFEILEHKTMEEIGEVLVLGRLSAGGAIKCQFGSSAITRVKQTREIVSIADDLKAAATDALKKCASQLGVGLYLYKGGSSKGKQSGKKGNGSTPHTRQNASGDSGSNQKPKKDGINGNGRLSPKQHGLIVKLVTEAGITRHEFDQQCLERYGTVLDHLSKASASQVIGQMLN